MSHHGNHVVSFDEQFSAHLGTDQASGAGDEDAHDNPRFQSLDTAVT